MLHLTKKEENLLILRCTEFRATYQILHKSVQHSKQWKVLFSISLGNVVYFNNLQYTSGKTNIHKEKMWNNANR